MDNNFIPIGSSNPQNRDQRVSFDPAHGEHPDHIDMVVPIPGIGAHKIRVNANAEIFTDEIV